MSEDEKDGKDDKSDKSDKPLFISRCIAFILDAFIVMLISTIIAYPFMNQDKMLSLAESSQELLLKYNNSEITDQEYLVDASNLEYQMAQSTELIMIIIVFISLLYYVVLPIYNNGQTLGKKFMKLKIISTLGDLNSNQLIFRTFIANSVLLRLISILFVMFASRDIYAYCVELFSFAQYTIMAASVIMMVLSQEGLTVHDKLVHTKVIKVN